MERPSNTPAALMLGGLFGALFGCVIVLSICAWQARAAWVQSQSGGGATVPPPALTPAATLAIPADSAAEPYPSYSSDYGEGPSYIVPATPNDTSEEVKYYAVPEFSAEDMIRENDEPVDDEPIDDEQSGDEQSGDEQSGDEQSGDEQSGDEQSGDEQSGDES